MTICVDTEYIAERKLACSDAVYSGSPAKQELLIANRILNV